ncbi:MAG TPA: type IV pilin N-terminal domain-containing protein [Candidatus Thermoplasmatota archaeon]|nr:type IV pilin N-terminal domain-containing protein [Candidatus Thermoplasmatota archaeon]
MKANQFLFGKDDDAVSPVIAVILMVAITVVLAATVYVWVSGFGTSGSIKKFPQVTLKDDSDALDTAADEDETIGVLEHRGGDNINWGDYTVNVFKGTSTTATTQVVYTTTAPVAGSCAGGIAAPTSNFAVGNKLYVCEDGTNAWATGTQLKIQVIDKNQNSVVYENTVVPN